MRVRLKQEALQELVARSKRSQNAWAMRVGLSRGHWSDIVNGRHPYPSAKSRAQILEAFGVELEALFEIEAGAAEPPVAAGLGGRYEIDRLIGEGAMGSVYRARDTRFGRPVAIKLIAEEAVGGLGSETFLSEIRRTARLQHPNILPLFDAGEAGDRPYYVMPEVEGSLRDRLSADGAIAVDAVLRILRGVAEAIDHAHRQGVLHCDIKPENILLAGEHAYVADFGLSRALHLTAIREWERPPEIDTAAGTPAYVSPEQARGRIDLDARSDVYSLACVAFEMLSGAPPYRGGSTTEIVRRRFDAVPPDLAAVRPGVSPEVAAVIAQAMSLDPDRRPATARELVDRLAAAVAAREPSGAPATATGAVATAASALTRWALTRAPRRPRGSLMQELLDDLRFSLRSLRRRPLFAAVAIVTLALGIGANVAIFSVVNAAVLRPLPFEDPDRLVRVYSTYEGSICCVVSAPNFVDLRERLDQFEDLAAYTPATVTLTGKGDPERISGYGVSDGLFEVVGARPQLGRFISAEDDTFGAAPVVVISDRLWRDRYEADPDIVGETLTIDSEPHTIIGVAPPGFRVTGRPQLFLPFAWNPEEMPSRNANSFIVVGRLADGVSFEQASAELEAAYASLVEAYPDIINKGAAMRAFPEWLMGASQREPLILLWGAVAVVLLVACANVVNLMLARAETRQRELAIRSALGAGRGRLVRHFLSESMLVSLAGGVLGVAGAYAGLEVLLSNYGGAVPRADEVAIDLTALGFALGASLLAGCLVGIVPALQAATGGIERALREGGRGGSGTRSRLRQALVVIEVGAALVLVLGAGLLLRSFWKVNQVDVGVDPERILSVQVSLPNARYPERADVEAFYGPFRDRVASLPGVESAGLGSALPFSNTWNNYSSISPIGEPDVASTFVESRRVETEFFEALGIGLRAGRWWDASDYLTTEDFADPDNQPVVRVLINEQLARELFSGREAIGRMIGSDPAGTGWEVLGVVADVREHGPARPAPPTVFFYTGTGYGSSMSLAVRASGDPMALVPQIRDIVRDLDPELPVFGVSRLDQMIAESLGDRRFVLSLLALFAGLALVLGAVGIYGVMAYTVERRTREIGVRQALGASRGRVVGMVISQGMRLAIVGIVIGIGGAYLMRQMLASLLFEISAVDPVTYTVVAATLGAVAALACWVPARRAAAVDPMNALRDD